MSDRPVKPPVKVTRVSALSTSPSAELIRWFKRSMTRENAIDVLRSLAWVVPLTILIWIYAVSAYSQQQTIARDSHFALSLKSSDPKRVLSMDNESQTIKVTLSGPQSAMETVIKELDSVGTEGLPVPVDPPHDNGTIDPNTVDLLSRVPLFNKFGISVVSAIPSQLHVTVDDLQQREVSVAVPPDLAQHLTAWSFDPSKATISGPKRVLDSLGSRLVATAEIGDRLPGQYSDVTVPLDVPADSEGLKLTPTSVKASFSVREADEQFVIASVPVWVCQPSILSRYKVQLTPPTFANVQVFGPPDKLALLRSNPPGFTPIAYVRVTKEDVGKPAAPRQVRFDLPEGVRLGDSDARKTVDVEVTEPPTGGE